MNVKRNGINHGIFQGEVESLGGVRSIDHKTAKPDGRVRQPQVGDLTGASTHPVGSLRDLLDRQTIGRVAQEFQMPGQIVTRLVFENQRACPGRKNDGHERDKHHSRDKSFLRKGVQFFPCLRFF